MAPRSWRAGDRRRREEEAEKLLFDFFKLCLFGWKQYDDEWVEGEERFPCQKHDACLLQLQILSTMDARVEARKKRDAKRRKVSILRLDNFHLLQLDDKNLIKMLARENKESRSRESSFLRLKDPRR